MTREQIQFLSYQNLVKAIHTGEITEKELRKHYTELRDIAEKRAKRVEKQIDKLEKEYGRVETEHFSKLKDIKSKNDLVKEFSQLSRYVNKKTSSISGMKERKQQQIQYWQENEFPFVNSSNYGAFIKFLQWFHDSKWSAAFDSNDTIVEDVFKQSESATPAEWQKLMMEFINNYGNQEGNRRETR